MSSTNPYTVGDTVSIKRGTGWLTGTVVKTILARVHIEIDGNVFVEDWHDCKQLRQRRVRRRSRNG